MLPTTCVFPVVITGLAVGDMVFLSLNEGEQFCIDLILMRRGNAVRCAGVVDVLRTLDELGRLHSRVLHRNDLVVLAVKYQRRSIELLEVLGEVSLGEGFDTLVGV